VGRARARTTAPASDRIAAVLGMLVYATGAAALLATLSAGCVVAWTLIGPGKTYIFALDATVEWLEVEPITHPAVSRIIVLNAAGGGRDVAASGTVMPAENARVALERRGSAPARITLSVPSGSAGQLEWRAANGETQSADLEGETGFRVPILEAPAQEAPSCVKVRAHAECLPAGTLRAVLQGPLNLGEESPVAAAAPRNLAPGAATAQTISVRIFGRSALFSSGSIYELGEFALPPDVRLKAERGEASLWSTSVVPGGDGGLKVSATTTARELRVFSAAGPIDGDSISAGFFAVLFNDPDIAGLLSLAVLAGGACQLLELLRGRLERSRGSDAR